MANEDEYIPFGQRDEWSDIQPVFQDDGPAPVCAIAYSDQCTFLMRSHMVIKFVMDSQGHNELLSRYPKEE